MDQLLDTYLKVITGEAPATAETIAALTERWPASIVPDAIRLADPDTEAEEGERLRRRIAASLGDRQALMHILGDDTSRFDDFYPDPRRQSHSTEDTIDSFLGKFSSGDRSKEQALIEQTIFNPAAADYMSAIGAELPADEPQNGDGADNVSGESSSETSGENRSASPALSESLARVMIKNRNYTKALEIIQAISLNNPEKSVYFADQIRFLRKLIINDNNSK